MKFLCSRDSLMDAISTVQKAVSSRSTLPILDGILIECISPDTVKLTGYDLETGIEAVVHADVEKDGSVVILSRLFGDIVRKLPEEQVHIEIKDQLQISIESGASAFLIKGMSAEGFPKIPVVEDEKKLMLPQAVLKDMIRQTIFAVSSDESRPTLNGSLFRCDGFALEMVAIDGFRLAKRKHLHGQDLPEMNYIVPGKALHELVRILESKDEPMTIFSSSNHILFDIGNVRIVSRLIQGEYMNYKAIIPESSETRLVVPTQGLLQAIERAALIILSEDRRCPVSLTTPNDATLLIHASTDIGTLREEVAVAMEGGSIDIDFNPRYFIDALKVIEKEEIAVQFNGSNGPCVIVPTEGEDFSYLVLPLRR